MTDLAEGAINGAVQIAILSLLARWFVRSFLGRSYGSVVGFSLGLGALLAGGGQFALDDPNGWEAAGRFMAGSAVLITLWWVWFKKPSSMLDEQANG